MNRTLAGVALGVGAAVLIALVSWWAGWLQFGPAAPMPHATAMAGGAQPGAAPMPGMPMQGSGAGQGEHAGPAEHAMEGNQAAGAQEAMAGMEHGGAAAPAADIPADAVMISPERQQLIGVRTARVERASVEHTIRTVGEVTYDERRVAHIHTRIKGWIEKLHVDFTGKLVEKGQPLLEIYSPELVSTQEEYLLALRARDSLGNSPFAEIASSSRSLLEATRRRLLLWEITPEQIRELEERNEPQTTLTLFSPIRGFVINKNAWEGKFVGPQDELYTIADLRRVWVLADVYESELDYVRPGQPAAISLSYLPGQEFTGRVDYIYPYLEGETRTVKVRVVLDNPGWQLKPDMFANVQLRTRLGEALMIPEDAVIDTGERQVVFLALPGGHFQPREIEVAGRFNGKIRVLSGLEEGDTVVSGATFLIDSESKLRSAMGNMAGHQH